MKRTILAPGHELLSYRIHEVTPYINWIYFFHAWGFQPRFAAIANIHGCDSCRALWLTTFPEEERTKASEAMQLFKEANRMLDRLDETISIHCIFRLCQANADGDNLLIEGTTFPLLRQQTPQPDGGPFLCLSDFVRPLSSGTPDIVGLFASTISEEAEETYKNDPYKHLLVQTLNDRLAEAATEKMHASVRPCRVPSLKQYDHRSSLHKLPCCSCCARYTNLFSFHPLPSGSYFAINRNPLFSRLSVYKLPLKGRQLPIHITFSWYSIN